MGGLNRQIDFSDVVDKKQKWLKVDSDSSYEIKILNCQESKLEKTVSFIFGKIKSINR